MTPEVALFARTFAIGVAVAAPIGAMGVLCIRRTLADGWRAGLATGLGVATADGIYAACAAFGLAAVTDALVSYQVPLRLLGGAALVYLGIRAFRSDPTACEPARGTHGGTYLSAVGLTLTNPATILAFAAIFAGVGLAGEHGGWLFASIATAGVASGSLAWWVGLTGALVVVRRRADDRFGRVVNRVSGFALVALGLAAAASAIL